MTQRERIEELAERLVNQIETLITEGRLIELDLLEQAINQSRNMNEYKLMRLEALKASLKGKQAVEAKIKEIEK